jgi:hypothetical protein
MSTVVKYIIYFQGEGESDIEEESWEEEVTRFYEKTDGSSYKEIYSSDSLLKLVPKRM